MHARVELRAVWREEDGDGSFVWCASSDGAGLAAVRAGHGPAPGRQARAAVWSHSDAVRIASGVVKAPGCDPDGTGAGVQGRSFDDLPCLQAVEADASNKRGDTPRARSDAKKGVRSHRDARGTCFCREEPDKTKALCHQRCTPTLRCALWPPTRRLCYYRLHDFAL
jgi:hypothetical protein